MSMFEVKLFIVAADAPFGLSLLLARVECVPASPGIPSGPVLQPARASDLTKHRTQACAL